jgi:hypothetical protein
VPARDIDRGVGASTCTTKYSEEREGDTRSERERGLDEIGKEKRG